MDHYRAPRPDRLNYWSEIKHMLGPNVPLTERVLDPVELESQQNLGESWSLVTTIMETQMLFIIVLFLIKPVFSHKLFYCFATGQHVDKQRKILPQGNLEEVHVNQRFTSMHSSSQGGPTFPEL